MVDLFKRLTGSIRSLSIFLKDRKDRMIKDRKIEFPTLPTGNKIMVGNLFIVFLSNWSFLCSNDRFDSEKDQIDSLAVDLLKDRQDRFAHGHFFKRTTGLIRLWSKYRRQRFDLKDRRSRDQKIEFLTLPPCPSRNCSCWQDLPGAPGQ